MSCQTQPHISSDVREGSWVGGKSSPLAVMLSYTNLTRKRVPSISPHHNIHVRIFKDPWRLNGMRMSNLICSATILLWTCTDRAVMDAKKEMLLKCSLSRGGRKASCCLSRTGNPRSRRIRCAPWSVLSRRGHREDRDVHLCFLTDVARWPSSSPLHPHSVVLLELWLTFS